MLSLFANSFVVLELCRVEVDIPDFNGDNKHKASGNQRLSTDAPFLANDLTAHEACFPNHTLKSFVNSYETYVW